MIQLAIVVFIVNTRSQWYMYISIGRILFCVQCEITLSSMLARLCEHGNNETTFFE